MSEQGEAVRAHILGYLRERREFEMDAHRRAAGLEGAERGVAWEEVRQRFEVYRARHLAPEAVCVLTSAPHGSVDPDSVQWLTIKVSGDRAIARTNEPDAFLPPWEHEYQLERRDGCWLLTERRVRDPLSPRRWIKGLL